jgi:hypothetical protein
MLEIEYIFQIELIFSINGFGYRIYSKDFPYCHVYWHEEENPEVFELMKRTILTPVIKAHPLFIDNIHHV